MPNDLDAGGFQEHALSVFRSILDSMSDGVAVADAEGRMVYMNRAGQALAGRGVAPEGHQTWTTYYGVFRADGVTPMPPEEVPLVRALRGESGDQMELFLRNPGVLEGRYLSVTFRPWMDSHGRHLGGIVVYRDISELRRAEAAKKQMVDMIVHDLQNPLAGIQAYLQLVGTRLGNEPGPDAEALREAIRRCRDLNEMILNVLSVSRAEEGKLSASIEDLDLAGLARQAVGSFAAVAQLEGRHLRAEAPTALWVRADPFLAGRIVENLIRNALRHTPRETSVVVRVGAQQGGKGEVSVIDDGPGIAPEVQPHLFERFGAAVLRQRGIRVDSGLGLAFCRVAAEVMGATISVESDGRRGSAFRLRFPAPQA